MLAESSRKRGRIGSRFGVARVRRCWMWGWYIRLIMKREFAFSIFTRCMEGVRVEGLETKVMMSWLERRFLSELSTMRGYIRRIMCPAITARAQMAVPSSIADHPVWSVALSSRMTVDILPQVVTGLPRYMTLKQAPKSGKSLCIFHQITASIGSRPFAIQRNL